jgi:hypothetical protein
VVCLPSNLGGVARRRSIPRSDCASSALVEQSRLTDATRGVVPETQPMRDAEG